MTELIPTTSYLIRAIHEWCIDNGLTPHLLVQVDANTRVPTAYVKNGEIVLNINYSATKDLMIDQQAVSFSARFAGVSQSLYIPIGAVKGIFARENGQGMFFEQTHASKLDSDSLDKSNQEQVKVPENVAEIKPAKGAHLKLIK